MNEKPLERLNYYNGMPLQASDFKTEQDYHMRTRRWLNKSLYSAGIARGLEVRAITEGPKIDTPYVAVSPGLALDSEGREIILFDEALVEVCSYSGTNESTVVGNYLVIEYAEETLAYESGGCAVRTPETSASKSTNQWGGPSRIQARVKFSWVAFVPQPGSNQIVLARVELTLPHCDSVYQIDAGARRYIGAASAATVRQYVLEGEREIAAIPTTTNVPLLVTATVLFHIRRQPSSITLFLKAEELSALHYTELAAHGHSLSVNGSTGDSNPPLEHQHSAGGYTAAGTWTDTTGNLQSSDHPHGLKARMGYVGQDRVQWGVIPPVTVLREPDPYADDRRAAFFLIEREWGVHVGLNVQLPPPLSLFNDLVIAPETDSKTDNDILKHTQGTIDGGQHHHAITGNSGNSTGSARPSLQHTHSISGSGTSGDTGTYDPAQSAKRARVGKPPLTFVSNLQIAIDGVNRTIQIRDQILDSVPGDQKPAWQLGLGNGTDSHPLANKNIDAIPIRLDFLPDMTFGEGQHVIEFSVRLTREGEANGGKIHYNLYIE